MPTVSRSSERYKLAKKIRIFVQQLFYCGSILLLTGTLVCLPFSDKIFISSLVNSALILFWCVIGFSCGFLMCAPSWAWSGEQSNDRSNLPEVSGSTTCWMSEDDLPRGVVVESPPSYESVLSSNDITPPPKYEDALNNLFLHSGQPPYRDPGAVCPVHKETISESVRVPRSAQQWRYLQWPEPRVWQPREPKKTDISYLQIL